MKEVEVERGKKDDRRSRSRRRRRRRRTQITHLRLLPDLLVARRRGAVKRVDAYGLGLAVEELVHALLERTHAGDHDADEHKGERRFRGHFLFFQARTAFFSQGGKSA